MNTRMSLAVSFLFAVPIIFSASASTNSNRQIWLWPYTNGANLGTAADPYDVSTQAKFDNLLRAFEQSTPTTTNITIRLLPGIYQTAGFSRDIHGDPSNQGWAPRHGWVIRGSGIENTTIRLTALTSSTTNNTVIWAHRLEDNGIEISDLTIDCNYPNLTSATHIQGIHLRGSYNRVSNVRVINARGGDTHEAWVITLGNASTDSFGNVISGCIVDEYQGGNCTAINVGNNNNEGSGYKTKTEALIANNQVVLNTSLGGIQIAYGGFAIRDARFINNYCLGATYGFILDSWENDNLVVAGNVLLGLSPYGIMINPPRINNAVIENNVVEMSGDNTTAIQISNNSSNVVISNNRFFIRDGYTNAYLRLDGNAHEVSIVNNTFDDGYSATTHTSRFFAIGNRTHTGKSVTGILDTPTGIEALNLSASSIYAGGATYTAATISARGTIVTEGPSSGGRLQVGRDDGTQLHLEAISSNRGVRIQSTGTGFITLAGDVDVLSQIRIKPGSAASPGIAFNMIGVGYNEYNTGLFKPAASNLGFSLAGNMSAKLSPTTLAVSNLVVGSTDAEFQPDNLSVNGSVKVRSSTGGNSSMQIGYDDGTYFYLKGLDNNRNIKIQPHGNGLVDFPSPIVAAGQLRIAPGSANSPGMAFNSIGTGYDELNTGIFKPAASSLAVSVASRVPSRFSPTTFAASNIVVGTTDATTPQDPLTIYGVLKSISTGNGQLQIGYDDGTYMHLRSVGGTRGIKIQPSVSGRVELTADTLIHNQLLIKSGSASSPGIAFNALGTGYDEFNTGIYKPSASNLAFSSAGTEVARFSPSGLTLGAGGSPLSRFLAIKTNLVFSLGSASSQVKTLSLNGCRPGDALSLGVPNICMTSNTIYQAWVSNTNEISIRAIKTSGSTPSVTGEFSVVAIQF